MALLNPWMLKDENRITGRLALCPSATRAGGRAAVAGRVAKVKPRRGGGGRARCPPEPAQVTLVATDTEPEDL
jgi:hypothetical protein